MTPNYNFYFESLCKTATSLDVADIADVVLSNPYFRMCAGSAHKGCHHYETGGLLRHTWEVWDIATDVINRFSNDDRYVKAENLPTDQEMFLVCLYHDVGKMWDYAYTDGEWKSTAHKRLIHHISRSGIEWSRAVDKFPRHRHIEESVLHAILAHHGHREWGSPVAPKSKLAWTLHLCDGLSARMDDADSLDIITVKK